MYTHREHAALPVFCWLILGPYSTEAFKKAQQVTRPEFYDLCDALRLLLELRWPFSSSSCVHVTANEWNSIKIREREKLSPSTTHQPTRSSSHKEKNLYYVNEIREEEWSRLCVFFRRKEVVVMRLFLADMWWFHHLFRSSLFVAVVLESLSSST